MKWRLPSLSSRGGCTHASPTGTGARRSAASTHPPPSQQDVQHTWSVTPPSKKILLPCFSAKKLRGDRCKGRGLVEHRLAQRLEASAACPPLSRMPALVLPRCPAAPIPLPQRPPEEVAPNHLEHHPIGGLVGGAGLGLVPAAGRRAGWGSFDGSPNPIEVCPLDSAHLITTRAGRGTWHASQHSIRYVSCTSPLDFVVDGAGGQAAVRQPGRKLG